VAAGLRVYATHRPQKPPPPIAGVDWVATDLGSPAPARHWPARCDTVVYLAQSKRWNAFPETAPDLFTVNVAGLTQALGYAQGAGVGRFVYVSTGSVYTQSRQPAVETEAIDLAASRSYYVACKLAGEVLLGPFQALFPVLSLRLFMPYGSGQNPEMLLPQLVRKVRAGETIQLHGRDGIVANPVAAADVAETLRRCLELDQSATLNVAGPRLLTLRAIGETIGRVTGREPRFEVQPQVLPRVIAGDTAALQAVLGWRPGTSLEDGLRAWLAEEAAAGPWRVSA
jgi:nucleoside-diphosphate-sugar epimerase